MITKLLKTTVLCLTTQAALAGSAWQEADTGFQSMFDHGQVATPRRVAQGVHARDPMEQEFRRLYESQRRADAAADSYRRMLEHKSWYGRVSSPESAGVPDPLQAAVNATLLD